MKWTLALVCAFLSIGGLAACSFQCDFDKDFDRNDLEKAAQYPQSWSPTRSLPVDVWVQNQDVENFLGKALETSPPASLAAKYGLQCLPREQPPCAGCFTCRKGFRDWIIGMDIPPIFKCVDLGEVLIQADIGPGTSVRAMTYWKTTPAGRTHIATVRSRPGSR